VVRAGGQPTPAFYFTLSIFHHRNELAEYHNPAPQTKENNTMAIKTETHAIFQNGSIQQSGWMDVLDAYAFIKELGDRVAESYTVYAGEDDCPVGECYEVYDEGKTAEDYPDGNPYADTITIFSSRE